MQDALHLIQKYADNNDALFFFEAACRARQNCALFASYVRNCAKSGPGRWPRVVAVRAVMTLGLRDCQNIVRVSLIEIPAEIDRRVLAELIESTPLCGDNVSLPLASIKITSLQSSRN